MRNDIIIESFFYHLESTRNLSKVISLLFLEVEMKIALYIFVAVVIHEAFGKHLLSSFFALRLNVRFT